MSENLSPRPSDDPDSDGEYLRLRREYENAVRDSDALIVKLAVAGLTLSAAARSILDGVDWLLASAVVLFAFAALGSLTSLRLAAIALGVQARDVANNIEPAVAYSRRATKHRWICRLDWFSYATVAGGLLAAMLFAVGAAPTT